MGETKTLNWLGRLARQVVLLSHENGVVVLDEGRALKLAKGQYGGWLTWEKNTHDMYQGLWCYKAVKRKPSQEDMQMADEVLERLKKITDSLGMRTQPNVSVVEYKYRIITAKREKATDRYSVYEISPSNEEVVATALRIEFPYKLGKRGRCGNDVCRLYDRLKRLIEAEFRESEAVVAGVNIIIPLDISEIEKTAARLLGVDAEEAKEAEKDVGGSAEGVEAAEAEEGGAKRYLVALLPGGVDEEAAADAVREALKRLGIKNPIVKVVEAEI
jgi:hypothetical protein